MAAFPVSTPCHGCINGMGCSNNGFCASNPDMFYASYCGLPHQSSMAFPPSCPTAPLSYDYASWYPILCQHYGGLGFLPQLPVGPFPYESFYCGPYLQHQYQGQWKGKNRKSKNKRHQNVECAQLLMEKSCSPLESAITLIKANPDATLFSIDGLIVEVATADDGALHFIQGRIQVGSEQERRLVLTAALMSFGMLWRDYRGSRMLQELLTSDSPEIKKELIVAFHKEGPLNLSLHKHGCRVIQTAITSIDDRDLTELISKFRGHVLALIHDPNGNHVVQRIIEAVSDHAKSAKAKEDDQLASDLTDQLQFMIDDVIEHVESLSIHSYGCRVVQRALEFCAEEQKNAVLSAILSCREKLMKDKYGNYVLQQTIVTGEESTRDVILSSITKRSGEESLLSLSKHKYASNVVEKLIQYGSSRQRETIVNELLNTREKSNVCIAIDMAKDNIANYVIKTAIECARADQKKQIMEELSRNLIELAKYPQATYIFNKEFTSVK
ncbi:hypothetical protein HJC23_013761 [Cyclotella cryptica]|uniref:PUM-HD domain-containing protein n=1 Tax=Cyclotella cryptica TaxID=29204 RepID=A0ABD3NN76_9STRA